MKIIFWLAVIVSMGCNYSSKQHAFSLCFVNDRFVRVYDFDLANDSVSDFVGKFVKVQGYYYYGFEQSEINPSTNSLSNLDHAFWVSTIDSKTVLIDVFFEKELEALNRKKVVLMGKIDTFSKGHMGMYTATLDSTFFIEEKP